MPQGVAAARLVSAKITIEFATNVLNLQGVMRIGYAPKNIAMTNPIFESLTVMPWCREY